MVELTSVSEMHFVVESAFRFARWAERTDFAHAPHRLSWLCVHAAFVTATQLQQHWVAGTLLMVDGPMLTDHC